METTDSIRLRLNGDARTVPSGLSVHALLAHVGQDPEQTGMAVALNDRVVRRAEWPARTVADGDRVEVITASQGG